MTPASPPPRARGQLAIVCLCAGVFYAVFVARSIFTVGASHVFTLFDDAMISMQYARNFADGHGLLWNAGEPPVEGYSNLLWVLVMAAVHRLSLPDTWAALPIAMLGIAILLATIWAASRIADAVSASTDTGAGVYAAILTATSYPLIYWTLRGMEVGLLALLLSLLVLALVDRGMRLPHRVLLAIISAAGMALTRDDGLVPVVAACAAAVLGGDRDTRRVIGAAASTLILTVGLHLAWRHSYYGEWVPNTYYLKLTGVGPAVRIGRGIDVFLAVLMRQLGPLLIVAALELWRSREWRRLTMAVPIAAVCAYSIYVGGDAWEFLNFANRYISPSIPLIGVLAGLYVARLRSERLSPRALVVGVSAIAIAGGGWDLAEKMALPFFTPHLLIWGVLMIGGGVVLLCDRRGTLLRGLSARTGLVPFVLCLLVVVGEGRPFAQWVRDNSQLTASERQVTVVGLMLQADTAPRASIAVFEAGSTPYFARRRAIDLLGKSDRHVAMMAATTFHPGHDKSDYDYSLRLRPDLVVTLSDQPEEMRSMLAHHGYERLCAELWARTDTDAIDRAALKRDCN